MWFEDLKAFLCEEICQSIYETAGNFYTSDSRKKSKNAKKRSLGPDFSGPRLRFLAIWFGFIFRPPR